MGIDFEIEEIMGMIDFEKYPEEYYDAKYLAEFMAFCKGQLIIYYYLIGHY